MPNTFLKPTVIARTALGLLMREIVLPQLVWRDAVRDFTGAQGDTVTVRVPARATARTRALRSAGPITVDDLTETAIPVQLTTDVYHAAGLSDEELTLDIGDFGAQVLMPQIKGVAEGLENLVAGVMSAAAYPTSLVLDATKPEDTLTDAGAALSKANVPKSDRFAVVGPDMAARFLKSEAIKRVDASGSDSALRDAMINRVSGFTIFESNAIGAGIGYAFHRTAYVLGTRAPVVPQGATSGGTEQYAGFAMRWIRDYDALNLRDRSIVNSYAGAAIVADGPDGPDAGTAPDFVRAVKLTLV